MWLTHLRTLTVGLGNYFTVCECRVVWLSAFLFAVYKEAISLKILKMMLVSVEFVNQWDTFCFQLFFVSCAVNLNSKIRCEAVSKLSVQYLQYLSVYLFGKIRFK